MGVLAVVRGSSTSGDVTAFGELMAVLALFAWVGYFVYSKQARQHLGTIEYLTVIMVVGVPLMLPLSLLTGQLTDQGWLSLSEYGWVLLVIVLPGTGHLLINWAHNHTTITLTSLLTLLMPAISTACAAVFLDQEVTALTVVGISIVLVSLAFVVAAMPAPRPSRRSPPRTGPRSEPPDLSRADLNDGAQSGGGSTSRSRSPSVAVRASERYRRAANRHTPSRRR